MTNVTASDEGVSAQEGRADAAPRRPAAPSGFSRVSFAVLVAGTVLAVAAAFGPPWLARVGVGVAIAVAVASWLIGGYELRAARRSHAREQLAASRAHGRSLHEERQRNAGVVDALTVRMRDLTATAEQRQQAVAALAQEVSGLRDGQARLAGELRHRDATITSLRDTVRTREAELRGLRELHELRELAELRERAGDGPAVDGSQVAAAEVHPMPRRGRAEGTDAGGEREHPAEVAALRAGPATPTVTQLILEAMVMPNYEDDRRFA